MKQRKGILLLLMLMLLVSLMSEVYARAGGGGGSSGGGFTRGPIGYLIAIVWGIYTVCLSILVFFKRRDAKRVIDIASDKLWDITGLENCAESAFFAMQKAWMDRDLHPVSKIITGNLYQNYQWQLDKMKKAGERNMLEDISIKSIQIISCKDYIENAKDSFTAYIKGTMVDYTINERSGTTIKGSNSTDTKFKDCYVFVRDENTWLLNSIINDPGLETILNAKSFSE